MIRYLTLVEVLNLHRQIIDQSVLDIAIIKMSNLTSVWKYGI